MSAVTVEAREVERRYPGGRGVGPVSLRVDAGETLALMGHNGAGKTTLLRLLATADRPRRGELRWHGERSPRAARRSLGLALDGVDEEPCLSGRQAAHFWCRRWVADRDRARRLVDAALGRFGLAEVADEPVGRYSYGMRRRLGLVEALAHEPALAFLDEPTAGLDPEGAGSLGDELRRRDGAGLTSVVASNDCAFVEAACGRVAFLAAGRLARCAAPHELLGDGDGTRVAELTLAGTADAAAFARLPGVRDAVAVEAGLRVRFSGAEALPAIVALADSTGPGLRTLRLRRADLGDCFAALTGRALEERA
ncbi:MAG TPA: ABC transporter ATP-binding protein [Candidatus Dormibacteraeota bacterium]|jgi:ABC-2 type transport system ATP-binding protein